MTEAWQQEGRINQKRRTRAAILAAAVEFLNEGKRPTVAEVADAALVSRATAYRYFPTQEYLLFEAALESTRSDIDRELDENTLPEDPEARLEMLIDALQKRIIDKEAAFRTMLKLSLEQSPQEEEQYGGESVPSPRLRGGGRVRWIEKALAPVEGRLEEPDFRRLVAALSLCMGIEALVVLRDVCALESSEAEEVLRWAARTLLRSSLAEVNASPS
ncbi:MAG: TetR/AcrR family transcriptional regulator [Actinomycetota bacterium]|nr:TetR/AcrR family transcriptional regulator [Actinomycetota bacterium]